jgi:subtilisin family serine protease
VSTRDRVALAVTNEPEDELAGLNIVQLGSEREALRACEALGNDSRVAYCHLVPERYLLHAKRARTRRTRSLDPLINRQWGLTAVQLKRAQQARGFTEASDVIVAVIDSGVDASHPDLQAVVFDEQNFTTGARRDTQGHGTHVIGIIAALRNNRIGISGVCQSRRIMSLKALGPYNAAGYYRAIRYATDNDARVINLSLGGSHDPTEELLIRRAIERKVVVVAAMGNEFEEGNPKSYPAAVEGVIAVGASTEVDRRASFSCTGRHISLVAPGDNILSTVPTYQSQLADTTDYEAWPGTSMATPFVAATVALMLAKRPNATVRQITQALRRGADRIDGQRGFTNELGYGRLNVAQTLAGI